MTCLGDRHKVAIHDLKTWPVYFEALWKGFKTVELRLNDRNYQSGDVLALREWEPPPKLSSGVSPLWGDKYTGRLVLAKVKHVLEGVGAVENVLPEGWVALSIEIIARLDGGA